MASCGAFCLSMSSGERSKFWWCGALSIDLHLYYSVCMILIACPSLWLADAHPHLAFGIADSALCSLASCHSQF